MIIESDMLTIRLSVHCGEYGRILALSLLRSLQFQAHEEGGVGEGKLLRAPQHLGGFTVAQKYTVHHNAPF